MEITKVVKPFIRRGWSNTFGNKVYFFPDGRGGLVMFLHDTGGVRFLFFFVVHVDLIFSFGGGGGGILLFTYESYYWDIIIWMTVTYKYMDVAKLLVNV